MRVRSRRFFDSAFLPLLCFALFACFCLLGLRHPEIDLPLVVTHLLLATVVTIVLILGLYLYHPIRKRVKRWSLIWIASVIIPFTIFVVGLNLGGLIDGVYQTDIVDRAWASYLWMFGLWTTLDSVSDGWNGTDADSI